MNGTFTLIVGCMFSGKTTAMLDHIERRAPGVVVQVFKHRIDNRYGTNAVVTHAGRSVSALAVDNAGELSARLLPAAKLIGIDEAHFFDHTLPILVAELKTRGMDVIATSLDLSSWGRPFRLIEQLRAVTDRYTRRYAVCARCGRRADHTQRLTPMVHGRLVGGPEAYEPRCGECWRCPPERSPPGE